LTVGLLMMDFFSGLPILFLPTGLPRPKDGRDVAEGLEIGEPSEEKLTFVPARFCGFPRPKEGRELLLERVVPPLRPPVEPLRLLVPVRFDPPLPPRLPPLNPPLLLLIGIIVSPLVKLAHRQCRAPASRRFPWQY
jgi:hypothetical protein